jgi:hypothetical protein
MLISAIADPLRIRTADTENTQDCRSGRRGSELKSKVVNELRLHGRRRSLGEFRSVRFNLQSTSHGNKQVFVPPSGGGQFWTPIGGRIA